jgi:hypothetical protein
MPDINIGAILEALNNKIDRDGHNAQSPCAVIVDKQDPTSANNYTWYRKWSDGWVEQGGINTTNETVTYLIPFADTYYNFQATQTAYSANGTPFAGNGYNLTTTTVSIANYGTTQYWVARGYAAN